MVFKLKIEEVAPSYGRLRAVASQVVACMASNLLLLDLGMAISFATIAVPDLLNASEGLSIDENQASWFGSIAFLTQPIGALVSGPMVDYFGRKKANFLVNIPHLIAWTMMYFAWNIPSLFFANALLGLGTGIMEAPINAYVGEVSEPSVRGALCTVTQVFTSVGIFVMFFLGKVVSWRLAALVCLCAPCSAMLMVLMVPETPVWLLVHGKEEAAMKSLRYLRGWTTQENVQAEFDQLQAYTKTLKQCVICYKTDEKEKICEHVHMNVFKKLILKFRYVMLCKETLRPLTLVMMYFMFNVMSGLAPIKPNLVNICGALGMPYSGKDVVVMVGVLTLITSILVVAFIKILGKRKLAISSMVTTAISCTALSVYARTHVPLTVFSYDTSTFPKETNIAPLIMLYAITFFTGIMIPWVLLGEVFPFRSRAISQGIAAAGNYLIIFLATKTFIDFEIHLKLWGTFAVYAIFGFVGTIYLYFFLPETEGKSLQEIESYYSGEFRIFADDPIINYFRKFKR